MKNIFRIIFCSFQISLLALQINPSNADSDYDLKIGKQAFENGDMATAQRLWEPLAIKGNPIAQYNMGTLFDQRTQNKNNYSLAIKWYQLSADQNYAPAQVNLGIMYYKGYGVSKNYQKSLKLYKKAAEQGNTLGLINLGIFYYNGSGSKPSLTKAYMWFTLAAAVDGDESRDTASMRDFIETKLNQSEIKQIQEQAESCLIQKYINCDFD